MLGADLSKTRDEIELSRNKGHQGHGGLEDRIRQTMRAEGISFAEAIILKRSRILTTLPNPISAVAATRSRAGDGSTISDS
jgi:hypothetical protein